MRFDRIIHSNNARKFQWYYSKLQILSRRKSFITDFSTPRVLRQLIEPSAQSVGISSRTIEERGNQVSADLIASNCARYFINFSRKSQSIDCSRAKRRFSHRKTVNFLSCLRIKNASATRYRRFVKLVTGRRASDG